MLTALQTAAWFTNRASNRKPLTGVTVGILCYFAQVTALATDSRPLFADTITAGANTPECPAVREAYARGGTPIASTKQTVGLSERDSTVLEKTWEEYGWLSEFDLIRLSRRPQGAWDMAFHQGGEGTVITLGMILGSVDMRGFDRSRTFAMSVEWVKARYGNTLRLLEDA